MAGKAIPVLLVTANVGSIFEDPSVMLKIWTEEFLQTISRLDPKFIAIHCQEVGGKNYERSMKHVEYFVRLLMSSEELRLFDKVRVYLDEDFSSAENFTALGNFYFIHETVSEALIWDFSAMSFVPATGKEVHSGNIEAVTTKEKAKFPQDFFPECKWSRKGFLRTRWSLNGTVFDLINIHLFHDASNFLAMESFPSVYCQNRRRALEHTLQRFHNDSYGTAPFFVFGDFNFRTDTQGVVARLSEGLNEVRVQSSKTDQTKMHYRDENSQVILSLGKKEFSHLQHQNIFRGDEGIWLKAFDRELESFIERLFEFKITFPPSYPFEEDENGAKSYMKTRCPAWCDRVILSNTATSLVKNISDPGSVEYGIIGSDTCMGDHKPVYLKLDLLTNAGIVCCCPVSRGTSLSNALCLNGLSRYPVLDTLTLPRLSSYAHEPYTPESMDTPSPIPSPIPGDMQDLQKSFNDSVTAKLRQQTDLVQSEQGSPVQAVRDVARPQYQSKDFEDVESLVDSNNADLNANPIQEVLSQSVRSLGIEPQCDNENNMEMESLDIKSFIQSPRVLVTQFAQIKNDFQYSEQLIESLENRGINDKPLFGNLNLGKETSNIDHKEISGVLEQDSIDMEPRSKSTDGDIGQNCNFIADSRDRSVESDGGMSVTNKQRPKSFVKCVQSQSAVEMKVSTLDNMSATNEKISVGHPESPPGMRTNRCFSDASWLRRNTVNKPLGRVRLISGCNSLTRLQSHHSSSDEDWFEEVHDPEIVQNDISAAKSEVSGTHFQNCNSFHHHLKSSVDRLKSESSLMKEGSKDPALTMLSPVASTCSSVMYGVAKNSAPVLATSSLPNVTNRSSQKNDTVVVESELVDNVFDNPITQHKSHDSIEAVRLYTAPGRMDIVNTSSVSQQCGDNSTGSLLAYFQEQSEVLSEVSLQSSLESNCHIAVKEPNKKCADCCVIL